MEELQNIDVTPTKIVTTGKEYDQTNEDDAVSRKTRQFIQVKMFIHK